MSSRSRQIKLATRGEPFSPTSAARAIVQRVVHQIRESTPDIPSWFHYYEKNHSDRIAFDVEIVERYIKKDEPIVEFGSSPLLLTGALAAVGYRVTGADIEPERFSEAARQQGLEIVKCDVENGVFPFKDEIFGAAIFNEVFEHLRINLIHTFSEVRRVVKPGGRLLLSTPNGRSYANLVNLLFHDRALDSGIYSAYEALSTVGHMGHVREYTVTDIVDFLEKMGFTCEEVVFRGRYPTNRGQLFVRLFPMLRPFFSVIARRR